MEVSVKLKWSKGLRFRAEAPQGRTIELNSAEEMGRAFTPMELFLVSIAGCTAMDVMWILKRQRQRIERFEISAGGARRDEDPKYYETIDLEYRLVGREIKESAVVRAIHLSQEKYCSVRAMIRDSVKVNITYRIANRGEEEKKFVYATTSNP